jgi:nucleoside-diphosphate-sugar epimerase
VVEVVWAALRRTDDPPMTRFLAEQLATAHWFDQRRSREVLQWTPTVGLDRGFELLAEAFAGQTAAA